MDLLLYWGQIIWGIEAFKWVFIGIMVISIILLAFSSFFDPSFLIDVVIDVIVLIVFSCLHFPVQGIIITVLILNIVSAIVYAIITISTGGMGVVGLILQSIYAIGSIIGVILFYTKVL